MFSILSSIETLKIKDSIDELLQQEETIKMNASKNASKKFQICIRESGRKSFHQKS